MKGKMNLFIISFTAVLLLASCATPPQASPPPATISTPEGQTFDKGLEILAQQIVASLPSDKKPLMQSWTLAI